ncbi:MAG: HPr family phosphocarrier protein [Clostridiales bacterium]|nr:HPr family phosphocarrier protein [Clostridiales bacterium]
MTEINIRLSSVRDVQKFVGTLTTLPGDFELTRGAYVLDARSLMGIFGFDLTKPLRLRVHDDRPETLAAIRPYQVDGEDDTDEQ